ncbi:UNVERIFIED_CONTAM: hypothetical protein GTU68_057643 [Idotea baltica]|nr:hypothetical protein [Idotea baltica]
MPEYKAPQRDIKFVLNEVLNVEQHYQQLPGFEEATSDVVDAIIEEGAKFSERVLSPLNQIGDQQGCRFEDGVVTTPDGFKEAYEQFVEAGWPSLPHKPEWGGQGLPESLGIVINELIGTANWSWSMYPGLSHRAMATLDEHGTDTQKQTYLTKLISGEWTGTMCLTESHCGTDLGMLRTRAEPNDDGSYNVTGTKIFISAGEHDMAENIVHIVLARLPDAPEGTKGISLFIVPKFLPEGDGSSSEGNGVSCGSIEHKMGIHGNATCVINFDGAKGFLIGQENRGLNCMFTFMNAARIGTGTTQIQALDLLGRKVLMTQGESLRKFTKIIHKFCKEESSNKAMKPFIKPLAELNKEWGNLTMGIGMKAMKNRDEVGAASVDYLMYSGYVTLAYLWARMAKTANEQLKEGVNDADFYKAKLITARFYYERILPRTRSLVVTMTSGADNLMELDADLFSVDH